VAFGYIQGLYRSENYPKDKPCSKCKAFALPIANMQYGGSLIIKLAGELFAGGNFENIGASKRMKKLYKAY
jgi:hypothetical protein